MKKKPPPTQLGFDLTSRRYVVIHSVKGTTYYRATGKALEGGPGHGWTTRKDLAEVVMAPPAGFGWGDLTPC